MPKAGRNFAALTMLCNVIPCLMHRSSWCRILSNLSTNSMVCKVAWKNNHDIEWPMDAVARGSIQPAWLVLFWSKINTLQCYPFFPVCQLWRFACICNDHCFIVRYDDPINSSTLKRHLYITPGLKAAFPGLFTTLRQLFAIKHVLETCCSLTVRLVWQWNMQHQMAAFLWETFLHQQPRIKCTQQRCQTLATLCLKWRTKKLVCQARRPLTRMHLLSGLFSNELWHATSCEMQLCVLQLWASVFPANLFEHCRLVTDVFSVGEVQSLCCFLCLHVSVQYFLLYSVWGVPKSFLSLECLTGTVPLH